MSTEQRARELLSAWTRHTAPSAAIRDRTWAAVQARASAGELGPDFGPEPSGGARAAKLVGSRLRLLLGGLGVTAVIAGVGLGLSTLEPSSASDDAALADVDGSARSPGAPEATPKPPSAEPELEAARPVDSPDSARIVAPAAATAANYADADAAPTPTPKPRATATAPSEGPNEQPDTLTIEMQLLGAARMALKSGDIDLALAKLDEHADRFPKGALVSERELSRVTALCKAGRLDAAEAAARRFVEAHPGTTEAKRLHNTCVGARLASSAPKFEKDPRTERAGQ